MQLICEYWIYCIPRLHLHVIPDLMNSDLDNFWLRRTSLNVWKQSRNSWKHATDRANILFTLKVIELAFSHRFSSQWSHSMYSALCILYSLLRICLPCYFSLYTCAAPIHQTSSHQITLNIVSWIQISPYHIKYLQKSPYLLLFNYSLSVGLHAW